jgi:hypothetical protein
VTDPVHVPARPGWDCAACARPWPCDPAREELATRYPRTILAIVAATYLGQATGDMLTAAPAELYERFLSWTRQPGAGQEACRQVPQPSVWNP